MQCSPFSCLSSNTINTAPARESAGNRAIEKNMKLAEKARARTIRVLLLGPGSSGKTTIVKQMEKIHVHNDVEELKKRKSIRKFVKQSVIDYMKILCIESIELHNKYNENTLVSQENEHVRQEMLSLEAPYDLNEDIAKKMKTLWADNGIKNTLTKREYFQIHENVAHFLDRIDCVSAASYTPSFEDYIRFRQVTSGLSHTKIGVNINTFDQYMFDFTDIGGQRSERRKWMQYISDQIDAVIYVLAISDYDLTMFEDNKTNRLVDSIELFKDTMIKRNFFRNKSVLVFFNKYDLFVEKIKKTPITVAFDDFPRSEMDPNDADDVIRFVAEKFLNVFREANVSLVSPLHITRTTALDTKNIETIFAKITVDLVRENFKDINII